MRTLHTTDYFGAKQAVAVMGGEGFGDTEGCGNGGGEDITLATLGVELIAGL